MTSALLSVPIYLGTAVYCGFATAVLYPCLGMLVASVVICAFVAWDMEHRIVERFARRPLDFAARYGGEEFALVLYDVPEPTARRIAEELRAAVEEARI